MKGGDLDREAELDSCKLDSIPMYPLDLDLRWSEWSISLCGTNAAANGHAGRLWGMGERAGRAFFAMYVERSKTVTASFDFKNLTALPFLALISISRVFEENGTNFWLPFDF